ncbi:MAG: hypothetical protein ACI8PD_001610 [Nitrospinales bacterium]|jgi:hypothetical protein
MKDGINFRIAIRVPEIFYVLRNHESNEPDRFDKEAELIKQHQSDEEGPISADVQLGRDQINKLCNTLKSTFTTDTKNISTFKNYIFNLESDSKDAALLEVENYMQEMRNIEQSFTGENLSNFFLRHWPEKPEDFYFMLKSIDLAGIRVVRDSSLLESLTDEDKISIFLESC